MAVISTLYSGSPVETFQHGATLRLDIEVDQENLFAVPQPGEMLYLVTHLPRMLSDSHHLALAVLRGDDSAAFALADEITARVQQPEGFKIREELLRVIEDLKRDTAASRGVIASLATAAAIREGRG